MDIVPLAGVADPQVTEHLGGSTTVNNDARRRVWVAQIPVEGDYRIQTDGNVSAFINPHLAFGHRGSATDEGIRIQQLKTIAALRDSGALTEEEFEAEKRRILGS